MLWRVAPRVLKLEPADRAAIVGPLTLIAAVTAIVMPARVFGAVLLGLQDVKFYGVLSTTNWAIDLVITVTLLLKGYGLYALALGAAVPSVLGVVVMFARVRVIAPDLMSGWPRPSWDEVARLFREGFGAWLGALGLAPVGGHRRHRPRVARESRRDHDARDDRQAGPDAHADVVGAGRQQPRRPRPVVGRAASRPHARGRRRGLPRLSGAGDRRHVRRARGQRRVRARLGRRASVRRRGGSTRSWPTLIVVGTVTHGVATIASVLGRRMHVGVATLVAGAVQVGLALLLSRRFGVIGVPIAALVRPGVACSFPR